MKIQTESLKLLNYCYFESDKIHNKFDSCHKRGKMKKTRRILRVEESTIKKWKENVQIN